MLQIENLTKTYAGNQKPSVDNLSLTVNDGEIFGFIGPNGAGKSTTIKSITGIISFEEGKVLIDGIDLKTAPLEAKKHIGYVSDDHVLYEGLTGVEYVNFICDVFQVPSAQRQERLDKYCELFALTDSVKKQISHLFARNEAKTQHNRRAYTRAENLDFGRAYDGTRSPIRIQPQTTHARACGQGKQCVFLLARVGSR